MNRTLLMLLMTLTVACDDTSKDTADTGVDTDTMDTDTTDTMDTDTTDTLTNTGAPVILGWTPQCADSETFEGTANISGAASPFATLNIWETGAPDAQAWNEEHELVDGSISLTQVSSPGDILDNGDGTGTSLFGCDTGEQFDLDETTLTYAIRIYDLDGNFADCIQFGHEPETVSGGDYTTAGGEPSFPSEFGGCRTLE